MNKLQYLLGKLAEEASKVANEALKTQYFGFDYKNPKTGETNKEALQREVQDFLIVLGMLGEEYDFDVDITKLAQRTGDKVIKIEKYYKIMKELESE